MYGCMNILYTEMGHIECLAEKLKYKGRERDHFIKYYSIHLNKYHDFKLVWL